MQGGKINLRFVLIVSVLVICVLVAVGLVLVLFLFLGIWASRYTKVGPNQVLVVSGRKARDAHRWATRLVERAAQETER